MDEAYLILKYGGNSIYDVLNNQELIKIKEKEHITTYIAAPKKRQ